MKRIFVLVATLLLVSGFALVEAQTGGGPVCLDMTVYCDGMELNLNNNRITGFWVNTDCAGTDVPISGKILSGPLGYGGYWFGSVNGYQWAFFAEIPPDGSMEMYQWSGSQWVLWISGIAYTVAPGPCPFDDSTGNPKNALCWIE